jgi:hypothetical protein
VWTHRAGRAGNVRGKRHRIAYAAQRKVYPREVSGRFARARNLAMIVLLGLFYGLPWISWNHRQAILFDLPTRSSSFLD